VRMRLPPITRSYSRPNCERTIAMASRMPLIFSAFCSRNGLVDERPYGFERGSCH
jgi:hypothetical protein